MAKKPKNADAAGTTSAPTSDNPAIAPAAPTTTEAPAAPAAAPKPPRVKGEQQNGVTRPLAGTATGSVWEMADKLTKASGKAAIRADVVEACAAAGTNRSTATTQYGKWAKFHGHVGEKSAGRKAKPEAGATAPAAPEAPVAPATAPSTAPAAPGAWDRGYEACQQAATSGAAFENPFPPDTAEAGAFVTGWNQAAADIKAAQEKIG